MPHIQQLSPHVADLIAAGEVVERPASVMKELLENAIDAGATAVVAEIENGGMTSIRVTDNGCGIPPEELPTAFLRHATSKLRRAEDLAAIGTLGFRGEALAAISAVSRVDIFSRCKDAVAGAALSLSGGTPGSVESTGCPEGTTIVVRELFYNTPARLKFMKSDSAEAAAVAALVQSVALSHPEVSIQYIRDGREEVHTPGDGKLLSAIYAARGRDFARSLTPVEGGGEGVSVRGFVTDPLFSRGTRAMQTFFCCGRMIRSPLLTAALEEAYANRQMKGKFPGCVLHIDLPLNQVDVNVHPAKTVVKFVNERAVFSAVCHVVRDALDAAPRQEAAPAPQNTFFRTMDAKTFRSEAVRPSPAPQSPAKPLSSPPSHSGPELGGRVTLRDGAPPLFPSARPLAVPADEQGRQPPTGKEAPSPDAAAAAFSQPAPIQAASEGEAVPAAEQTSLLQEMRRPWRFAGEVLHTYIIAEDGDDVYLIDKHAAHERINFDRLKASAEPIMRQRLLSPAAVELPREQCAALLGQLPLLEEFGFEAEDFGDGCLMVRAVPAEIRQGDIRDTLELLAETLLKCGGADPSAARDAVLHTVACKAAIKGGWQSDEAELRALIDRVQSGEVQFCPHGRPVKVKLTRYQLEKMFKRA